MGGPLELSEKYIVLPFNREAFGEKTLVSNDAGAWIFLDREDLELLNSHRVEEKPELMHSLLGLGLIATEDDFPFIRKRLKNRLWHLNNGTSLNVVAVTNRCNLQCRYCYAPPANQEEMSSETAEKVAEFAFSSPSQECVIEFSGGEPLLNFGAIKTLVKKSKELSETTGKKVGFAMIHNGTNWDGEKAEFFIRNGIGICFSLDGPKDLHDLNRKKIGGGGSYDDVVRWISEFRKRGYNRLNAIPVITRATLSRTKELVDEYLSHGFRVVRFKYLAYFGRAPALWKEIGYTPAEFLEAWKKVMDYIFELNLRGILVIEGMAQNLSKKIFNERDPGFCELQMPCGAGLGQLAYSPDGGVYTCDEGRMFEEFRVGDVSRKYAEIMRSPVLKKMALASSGFFDICSNCAFRPFCGTCPLERYNLQGDIIGKTPLDRRCEVHKGMLQYIFERMKEPAFRKMIEGWAKTTTPADLEFFSTRTNKII